MWYYTGDEGYYDEDFRIFLNNTHDNCIEYKQDLLMPGFIEDTLYTHPAVSKAFVTAVQHPINNQHPITCVKTNRSKGLKLVVFFPIKSNKSNKSVYEKFTLYLR